MTTERYRRGFVADLFRMDGEVAVVTGGHGELAEAIACTLADLGCSVVLAARKVDQCQDLAARVAERFGVSVQAERCDVTDEDSVERLVAAVFERHGRLDVLVNNAGASWWGLPHEIPVGGWRKVVDVNLTGTFLCCRSAARRMIPQRRGRMINVASTGAFLSYRPDAGQVVPYTTSKAAVVHLTRDLAAQWAAHGLRVNAIAPGSIESGMTNTLGDDYRGKLADAILLGRLGTPIEVAGVVATLASSAGSFITGQTYVIDGGQAIG